MRRTVVLVLALLLFALIMPGGAVATEPVYLTPWEAPDPVPAYTQLVVPGGWMTVTRGQAMSAPTFLDWYFTVWDEDGQPVAWCTAEESSGYWDAEVIELSADESGAQPFNPRIGAKQYLRQWRYVIEDGLPAGHYRMSGGVVQSRPAFDLYWYFEGQHAPMKLEAGDFLAIEDWEFDVE